MNAVNRLIENQVRPRLWVETLWLLESLTANKPLREIKLQRGLNLIVSPPGAGSSGHGAGKTAFCQLLRFVLEDPHWSSGSMLRDELLQSSELKEGAVAARVYIGGEAWTVLKPWRHQKFYRASRTASWQQLASNEAENEFSAYQAALRYHLVDTLPVQELPESGQKIEWHHILAWCSRDQNARYQSYGQWREDGVGLSMPAKSPIALMRIVLGLLHDTATLSKLNGTAKEVESYKSKLQHLRDEPTRLLNYVRHQLIRRLGASEATPFRKDGLFESPNLLGLAKQRFDAYQEELRVIETERLELAEDRQNWIEARAPFQKNIDLLTNEIEQREALIAGDIERAEKLKKEAKSLERLLPTQCNAGNRLLRDCDYVIERVEQTQIDRLQGAAQYKQFKENLENELEPLRCQLSSLKTKVAPIDAQLEINAQENIELDQRYAQSLSSNQLLSDAVEDYEYYESVVSGNTQWPDLAEAESKLDVAQQQLARLKVQLEVERDTTKARRSDISSVMQSVAESLPSFTFGVFNDDDEYRSRPFQMGPKQSTTFKVLEILAGDIACLLDSASAQSFHPGFLLHDSPREAEMSESLLWALLSHVVLSEVESFQYIVTTSTEPTVGLTPYVRLRISSDDDNKLLFRRRMDITQAPLI